MCTFGGCLLTYINIVILQDNGCKKQLNIAKYLYVVIVRE